MDHQDDSVYIGRLEALRQLPIHGLRFTAADVDRGFQPVSNVVRKRH